MRRNIWNFCVLQLLLVVCSFGGFVYKVEPANIEGIGLGLSRKEFKELTSSGHKFRKSWDNFVATTGEILEVEFDGSDRVRQISGGNGSILTIEGHKVRTYNEHQQGGTSKKELAEKLGPPDKVDADIWEFKLVHSTLSVFWFDDMVGKVQLTEKI